MRTTIVEGSPLIKWPGGKRRLLPALSNCVPETFERYHEPFAGGAALFFSLRPSAATLSDINEHLIEMYRAVRDDPKRVVVALQRLKNDEASYYYTRDIYRPRNRFAKAARFLYLQRLSFNGIYRENLKGRYNVPYGYKLHLSNHSIDELNNASKALANASLLVTDFRSALSCVQKHDFVYLDPPYTVSHNNNGFIKYNQKLFSWEEQVQLAIIACEMSRHGVHVLVSNAYHMPLLNLYESQFRLFRYDRYSVIASDSNNRKRIAEAIMISKHTVINTYRNGLCEI